MPEAERATLGTPRARRGRRTPARNEPRAPGELAAPDQIDVETVAVLPKRWLAQTTSTDRYDAAVSDAQQPDTEQSLSGGSDARDSCAGANVTAHDTHLCGKERSPYAVGPVSEEAGARGR